MPRTADIESLRPAGAADEVDRFALTLSELVWREAHDRLRARGFALRERYAPDWIPSWRKLGNDDAWLEEHDFLWRDFEDCVAVEHATTMDAVRLFDNTPVALQLKPPTAQSLPILRRLAEHAGNPRNHACPLLDLTPLDESGSSTNALIAVYSLARDWRMPPMALVAEAVMFIDQILEGFAFLHEVNIAHRDIAARNIMMDPRPLFANGTNSLRNLTRVPLSEPSATHSRLFPAPGAQVSYWIIDFGLSTMFDSRAERRDVTWEGGPNEFPECWEISADGQRTPSKPYDAFKADVWCLGALLQRYFLPSMPRLTPLVRAMMDPTPEARPEMTDCMRAFRAVVREMSTRELARGVANAARMDWQPWSGIDEMTAGLRDWTRYLGAAAAFLIWRPEVRVGGVRIG